MRTAEEIFKAHYEKKAKKPCGDMELSHMRYAIDAMEEYAKEKVGDVPPPPPVEVSLPSISKEELFEEFREKFGILNHIPRWRPESKDTELKKFNWLYDKLSTNHDRVYEWLMNENREPAKTFFTSGPERTLANEIEFRMSKGK